MPDGSTAIPAVKEWKLRNGRTHVERTFSQSELTIEGESRLLRLVNETAEKLNQDGFPWDALGPLFDTTSPVDWKTAAELLGIIGGRVPDAFAELATILLSIYPTNEDGSPNAEYETDFRFLKAAISFKTIVAMVRVFVEQNDYQRMADPIGAILGQAARTGMAETNLNDTSPDAETTAAS